MTTVFLHGKKLRPREGKKITLDTQLVSHTTELEARLQRPSTKLFSLHFPFMIYVAFMIHGFHFFKVYLIKTKLFLKKGRQTLDPFFSKEVYI